MAEAYQLPLFSDISEPKPARDEQLNVTVARTFDVHQLNYIARDESIYPHISNDDSPPPEEFELYNLNTPSNYFLTIKNNNKLVGFWMLLERSPSIYDVHTCILPEGRGQVASLALPQALKYIFTATPAMLLVTQVPASNPEARKFATWAGFKSIYTSKNSWVKDGAKYDMDVMTLPIWDWFHRLKNGDSKSKAYSLISLLAINGQFDKSQYFYNLFVSILGDLGA